MMEPKTYLKRYCIQLMTVFWWSNSHYNISAGDDMSPYSAGTQVYTRYATAPYELSGLYPRFKGSLTHPIATI